MIEDSSAYILSYDVGSTSCKTCLYEVGDALHLVDHAMGEYSVHVMPNGGAEQDPDDWWTAMVDTTREIVARRPDITIRGISFCAQMQGLVLVDKALHPVRPAMSFMDQRSDKQKSDLLTHGIQIEGMNAFKLVRSLAANGAVAASVKDPVWKYKWVEENESEIFHKTHKWLDVKDYLIARSTGECTMTADSAFATFLTSKRHLHRRWHRGLLRMYGVKPEHLPRIVGATDVVGSLLEAPAHQLGLSPGIPVFGGGGDASMISVGAGATRTGDAYVYTGTSGWVSLTVEKPAVDVSRRIASITGAQQDKYLYFAEQETAGKCLEWALNHLAADEIGMYPGAQTVAEGPDSAYRNPYDYLMDSVRDVTPGSDGVIFTPWLHGNRCPFEDSAARGMFFNLSLSTGKPTMIRAVIEGIAFHQKWLLESIERRFKVPETLSFVGGGALSPLIAQILADILERTILRMSDPRHTGAAGAALTAAIGLGIVKGFESVPDYLVAEDEYHPSTEHSEAYRRNYRVFKRLYRANKSNFEILNRGER